MKYLNRNLSAFLIFFCAALLISYAFLSFYVKRKIKNRLAYIHGKASAIQVDLLSRDVHFQDLELSPTESIPCTLTIKTLQVNHINLYQLLIHEKIIIDEIDVNYGQIVYDRAFRKEKSDSSNTNMNITVNSISFTDTRVEIRKDTTVQFSAIFNFNIWNASIQTDSLHKLHYALAGISITADSININRTSGMYVIAIQRFHFNSDDQKIEVDSGLLIPNYSKFDFAHVKGEQTGRINLSIPRVTVEGIKLQEIINDTIFTASKAEITAFDLYSFKDKRVPFLRTKNIPLPIESFRQLPYLVQVDSVVIKDSRITIEEFPEDGIGSGTVVFEDINAAISRFSNRNDTLTTQALLKATGALMGVGKIDVTFSFPLDGSPIYTSTGSIMRMPLEKLNPVLENLVRLKVTSGQLNSLKFNFDYTDLRSTGTLEINYENLRMEGLNKKNESTNELKTLLISAVIKKDKDQSLSRLDRTGSIHIDRERKRKIFKVWWNSIL
jgi:hypothetical protein